MDAEAQPLDTSLPIAHPKDGSVLEDCRRIMRCYDKNTCHNKVDRQGRTIHIHFTPTPTDIGSKIGKKFVLGAMVKLGSVRIPEPMAGLTAPITSDDMPSKKKNMARSDEG